VSARNPFASAFAKALKPKPGPKPPPKNPSVVMRVRMHREDFEKLYKAARIIKARSPSGAVRDWSVQRAHLIITSYEANARAVGSGGSARVLGRPRV
jgi:hypothetical protein